MYREKIIDLTTGLETFRDYTKEEIIEVETAQTKVAQLKIKEEERIAARNAILEKLGLTEEEAKLLLG